MDADTTHTCGSSEDCRWHVVAALLGDGDWMSILVKVQCFEARVRQDPGLGAAIARLLPQSSRAPFHPDGSLPHRVQEPMQRCEPPNRSEQPSHAGIGPGQAAASPPARLPQPTSHNIDQPPVARRPVQRCRLPKPTGQPRHQGLGADQIAASGLVSPVTRRSRVTSSGQPIPPSEVQTMDTDQQTRARSSRQGEIAMTSAESATCGAGASRQGNDGGAPPARKPSGNAHIKLGERLEKLLRVWSEKPEKFFKLGIIPDENDTDENDTDGNEASENETDENESASSTYLFITDKLNSRLRNVAKLIWHLHRIALKRDGRKIQEQLLAKALHFRPEDVKKQCASLWGEGESFLGIVENLDTNYAVLLCLPEKNSPDFYKNLRAKNPTALERLVQDMKSSGIESEVGRHKKTMEKIVNHGLSLLVNQNVDLGLQIGMCMAESTPADSREKHRKRTRLLSSSVADSGSSAMDHDIMAASSAVSVIGHPTGQSYKRARIEPPFTGATPSPMGGDVLDTSEAANEAPASSSAITDHVADMNGAVAPRRGAGHIDHSAQVDTQLHSKTSSIPTPMDSSSVTSAEDTNTPSSCQTDGEARSMALGSQTCTPPDGVGRTPNMAPGLGAPSRTNTGLDTPALTPITTVGPPSPPAKIQEPSSMANDECSEMDRPNQSVMSISNIVASSEGNRTRIPGTNEVAVEPTDLEDMIVFDDQSPMRETAVGRLPGAGTPINPQGHPVSDTTAFKLARVRKATLSPSHTGLDAFQTTLRMFNAPSAASGAGCPNAAEQEYVFRPPPQYEIAELKEEIDGNWEPEDDTDGTSETQLKTIDSHRKYLIDKSTSPAVEILEQQSRNLIGKPCSPLKVTRHRYGTGSRVEVQSRNMELTHVHWQPALNDGWFKFHAAMLPQAKELLGTGYQLRPHLLYLRGTAYRCPDDAVGVVVAVIAQYKDHETDSRSPRDTSVRFFRRKPGDRKSETVACLKWPIAMIMDQDVAVHSLGGPVLLLLAPIHKACT
ncbi:uncharacterized protein B0I36DRAFT_59430 [Microdochium trichocladiopsis]|uniref:Uncharacterized protein n=1 Tax=Microdochium trichocladiopsis TaxID=1682393 RepID=A0A9P9BF18_9PEZI|nr:uncharacterized protein B0I36DRAFT_59430 [Microdochium trichocladiopsis]KAH7009403.1 hypothetical protein B0I36DRAFT_59430 [Microdochium trichocladiopsis]